MSGTPRLQSSRLRFGSCYFSVLAIEIHQGMAAGSFHFALDHATDEQHVISDLNRALDQTEEMGEDIVEHGDATLFIAPILDPREVISGRGKLFGMLLAMIGEQVNRKRFALCHAKRSTRSGSERDQ